MPSVVIIHAAEDTMPARALATKLRAAGLDPVIEKPPGEDLRRAVREADVVLALWSPRSVSNPALVEDVVFAGQQGEVVHARMQNAGAPPAFSRVESVDLTGWRGEDDFTPWRDLAKIITDRAGVAPLPPPPARGPSPFFQPGAPPGPAGAPPNMRATTQRTAAPPRPDLPGERTPPRPDIAPRPPEPRPAPRAESGPPLDPPVARRRPPEPDDEEKGGGRLVVIGIVTFILVAVIGGGGFFFWNNMQGSQAAGAAWEQVDKTDPGELRAFLDGEPGRFRAEAQETLAALEDDAFDRALAADTIDALEGYLSDFASGDQAVNNQHAVRARGRIAELRSAPVEEPLVEEIDPLTGLPYDPTAIPPAADPDLLPPGASDPPPAGAPLGGPAPDTGGGGPVPLSPPPAEEPLPTN